MGTLWQLSLIRCMAADFFFGLACICGWILDPNNANMFKLVMETHYRKASFRYRSEVTKPSQYVKT